MYIPESVYLLNFQVVFLVCLVDALVDLMNMCCWGLSFIFKDQGSGCTERKQCLGY